MCVCSCAMDFVLFLCRCDIFAYINKVLVRFQSFNIKYFRIYCILMI